MSLVTVEKQIRTLAPPGLTGVYGYEPGDTIALQGPLGIQKPQNIDGTTMKCWHRVGAELEFGEDVVTEGFGSFREVADAVARGAAQFGIMAVRSVLVDKDIGDRGAVPNIQMIKDRGFRVLRQELGVDIQFDLFGVEGGAEIEDIERVLYQDTAGVNIQCSDQIASKLPHAELVDCDDGIVGALELANSDDPGRSTDAVLAAPPAGKIPGLTRLHEGMENKGARTNFTVFTRADGPLRTEP